MRRSRARRYRSREPRPSSGSGARERILETAGRLFYRDGYRAVGVDTIIAESGVAKMTLYRHFRSKDELIAAYLERADRYLLQWIEGLIAPHADPRDALIGVFDGVAKLASSPECLGCAFVGAAAEFPEPEHPGHRVALGHKRAVAASLRELAEAAGATDPDELADELLLVMDGAWSASRVFGPGNHGRRAAEAARTLIGAHIDGDVPVPPGGSDP
ncbi:MAG TPA: TetR/AcrR family transcriptional regulator [Actinomycetota bacterium]|nr:TetR/AcrR family transcriptional regulator [Actinomycetota bacterium]